MEALLAFAVAVLAVALGAGIEMYGDVGNPAPAPQITCLAPRLFFVDDFGNGNLGTEVNFFRKVSPLELKRFCSDTATSSNAHTRGHINCPACQDARQRAMQITISAQLTFREAAQLWLDSRTFRDGKGRARFVSPETVRSYEAYIRALNRFFGDIPLEQIHIGNFIEYQEQRSSGELGIGEVSVEDKKAALAKRWGAAHEVGPNKINQELSVVVRIMKRANCWTTELEDSYERFQREEGDLDRALTPQEQEFFLEVAQSKEKWNFVYWYSVLALRTTAHNKELRTLRLGDLNLYSGTISIQPGGAKNKYRVRTIPLAPDAVFAAQRIRERAEACGSRDPQHFLMPYRVAPEFWDPTKPMSNSGIKKPFDEVRNAAGVPWFTVHGFRHTAITRLAEAGTPISIIMDMAGHMGRKMTMHYTHISDQAKRMAVAAAFNGSYYGDQGQVKHRPRATSGQETARTTTDRKKYV